MIVRILVFLLLLSLIPDLYLGIRYLRKCRWWWQILWYLPGLLLMIAGYKLSRGHDPMPDDMTYLNMFLFALGLIVVPKVVVAIASLCGRHGWKVGVALVPVLWFILFYGSFVGNHKLEVKHVEIAFEDLPPAFDGYRIVHFSDLHLGSMDSTLMQLAVDTMNAQKADVIVFTGDIQNKQPKEIEPFKELLSTLKAKDGVFSVLGNHDYANYMNISPYEAAVNEEKTIATQGDMNWNVLLNGRHIIRRGEESIVLAGMDNDGEEPFPEKGEINYALWGVNRQQFVVMLEHDPSSWRRKILPHSHTQLTLSGHTHGMQFELFGWSPLSMVKNECDGLYQIGSRYIYVSKGLGGVVPFRFGATPEVVVITLHRK